jgi:hypothetical protein
MLRKLFYLGWVVSVLSLSILKNSDGRSAIDLSAKEEQFTQEFNVNTTDERLAVTNPEMEAPVAIEPEAPAIQVASKKPIFDVTLYKNKNLINSKSFVPITMIYGGGLLAGNVINIEHLKALAQSLPFSDKPYILDIECWDVRTLDDTIANKNIDKYILVIDTLKQARPDLKFGYYGVLPDRDYGAPVSGNVGSIAQWEYRNKRLKRLAAHVDVVCPSLYTLTDSQAGWKVYATENIKRAREYSKPVYPYIWPQYHNGNVLLGGKNIPGEFWQKQLELVYQQADGVMIWGGFNAQKEFHGAMEWNENDLWWQVTRQFIGIN